MGITADEVAYFVAEGEAFLQLFHAALALFFAHTVDIRHKRDVFQPRHLAEHGVIVRHETEAHLCRGRVALDGIAEDGDFTLLVRQHPRQTFQRRGLACAVVSEKADYLPSFYRKRNAFHGIFGCAGILLFQSVHDDGFFFRSGRVTGRVSFTVHLDLNHIYVGFIFCVSLSIIRVVDPIFARISARTQHRQRFRLPHSSTISINYG